MATVQLSTYSLFLVRFFGGHPLPHQLMLWGKAIIVISVFFLNSFSVEAESIN